VAKGARGADPVYERVLASTAGMYGEVRGILGSTVPSILALGLDAVAGRLENVTTELPGSRMARQTGLPKGRACTVVIVARVGGRPGECRKLERGPAQAADAMDAGGK
jgi:hypothetical protein